MSTARGVTFFPALLLLLLPAPCDAAPIWARGQHLSTARPTFDAPSLEDSTRIADEALPNSHEMAGDESESNANTRRRLNPEESGPGVACPAFTGSPTAHALSRAPLSHHLSPPGTGGDGTRGVVVVVFIGEPPGQEQFSGGSSCVGLGGSTTKSDDRTTITTTAAEAAIWSGEGAGPGVTAKVGTTSLPVPPSPPGIEKLVQLGTLNLGNTKVSGTLRVPLLLMCEPI